MENGKNYIVSQFPWKVKIKNWASGDDAKKVSETNKRIGSDWGHTDGHDLQMQIMFLRSCLITITINHQTPLSPQTKNKTKN